MMVALAVLALFWGNCLSCPEVLLASGGAAHSCCPKSHSGQVKCDTQGLQHFVQGSAHAPVLLAVVATAEVSVFHVESPLTAPAVVLHLPHGSPGFFPTLRI